MRRRRLATGRSVEPWASAASKLLPRPNLIISATRPAAALALPAREAPPWWPSVVCAWPQSPSSSSVCESGRAVISTSWPSLSSSSTSGLSTNTCAVLVRSTQTLTSSLLGGSAILDLEELLDHHLKRGVLDAKALGQLALQHLSHLVGIARGVG